MNCRTHPAVRWFASASLALALWVGCSNDESTGESTTGGTTASDGTSGTAATDGTSATDSTSGSDGTDATMVIPGPVCTPGDLKGCTDDFQSAIVCNDAGDGFVSRQCKDDQGANSRCDAVEGCLFCRPLSRRCKDDETVETCNDQGDEWIITQSCNTDANGQTCVEGGSCIGLCELALKSKTYMGCDYWAADLDNAFVPGGGRGYYDAAGAQYAIVVSNPNKTQSATIEIFNSDGRVTHGSDQVAFPIEPLAPGELRTYKMPRRDIEGTVLAPLAYRVRASVPITAYQFNPLENANVFSNDASLLLPENVLDRWYIAMTREQTFEILRSYVTVIAVQAGDTNVTMTVTAPTLPGAGIPPMEAGESITRTLKQFDVLNIETNRPGSDLTGTSVQATRAVAVFGGSEAANAPNTASCIVAPGEEEGYCAYDGETECETPLQCLEFNTCCADHLEHQMFPVVSWGEHYIAARTFPRGGESDVWRILAAADNTQVTTVPPQVTIPVLHAGEWFEFQSAKDFEIIATKPIMVGQFLSAQDSPEPNVNGIPQPDDAGIGDPAFILAVPFEQYRDDYVFLAPNAYDLDYVTITAPTGAAVYYDGELLDPTHFDPIGTGKFSAIRFLIADGNHRVTSDEKVGIIVYGYDQYVSYGYPGGLDLEDLGKITDPTK
jgi:hypothetical protein